MYLKVQASGGGGDKHINIQIDTHINSMTRPGLGAGPRGKDWEHQFALISHNILLKTKYVNFCFNHSGFFVVVVEVFGIKFVSRK